MRNRLTIAYPVREGFVETDETIRVVWQEHLWNTGLVTRCWFMDPASICPAQVKERDIDHPGSDQ
ncbi:hypothetical protein [Ruegeria sp. Ofav3-42]|uniref:hypothetical protein n=1 Tax=Ruegeria sp. Ofav3-42 TaxID=2917759 RepID=UPI001EF7221E|nr:hypothetical protein [Ruegeria sp. Ofav3-42]MCG7521900.1 hypothetical protein [Ruegeria sp. Ofav3-42]